MGNVFEVMGRIKAGFRVMGQDVNSVIFLTTTLFNISMAIENQQTKILKMYISEFDEFLYIFHEWRGQNYMSAYLE